MKNISGKNFDTLFQSTSMPNWYGPAMSVITKISKVKFSYLRSLDHSSEVYVDDWYLKGDTYEACLNNMLDTLNLLRELGFVIHPEKPILTPSQETIFLGFAILVKKMTLTLTDEEKIKIKSIVS